MAKWWADEVKRLHRHHVLGSGLRKFVSDPDISMPTRIGDTLVVPEALWPFEDGLWVLAKIVDLFFPPSKTLPRVWTAGTQVGIGCAWPFSCSGGYGEFNEDDLETYLLQIDDLCREVRARQDDELEALVAELFSPSESTEASLPEESSAPVGAGTTTVTRTLNPRTGPPAGTPWACTWDGRWSA